MAAHSRISRSKDQAALAGLVEGCPGGFDLVGSAAEARGLGPVGPAHPGAQGTGFIIHGHGDVTSFYVDSARSGRLPGAAFLVWQ